MPAGSGRVCVRRHPGGGGHTFSREVLGIANLAELLHPELLEVRVVDVDLFLVSELAHLSVLLLQALAEPLSINAALQAGADVTFHATARALLL